MIFALILGIASIALFVHLVSLGRMDKSKDDTWCPEDEGCDTEECFYPACIDCGCEGPDRQ